MAGQLSKVLTGENDWLRWFQLLKLAAQGQGIWEYIDPKSTDTLTPPIRPVQPQPTVEGEGDTQRTVLPATHLVKKWEEDCKDYRDDQREYRVKEKAIRAFNSVIASSISEDFLVFIDEAETARDRLKALQSRFAPSGPSEQRKWETKYEDLKAIRRGQTTENWLDEWRTCLPYFRKVEVPQMQSKSMVFYRDFFEGLRPRQPVFTDALMLVYNKHLMAGTLAQMESIESLIEQARNFSATFPTTVTKPSGRPQANATAVSNQAPAARLSDVENNPNRLRKPLTCLCGDCHPFFECPYLMSPFWCPSGWRSDPQKAAQCQAKLEDSRESVQKAVKRCRNAREQGLAEDPGTAQRALKKQKTNNEGARPAPKTADQPKVAAATFKPPVQYYSDVEDEDSDSEPTRLTAGAVSRTAASLSKALKPSESRDFTLYDTGANTDIFNDITRFTNFRVQREIVDAGESSIVTTGIGDIELILDTPDGQKRFRLRNARYCKTFHTNVIARQSLRRKGIFFDDENTCLRRRGEIFAFLHDIDGLLHVERPSQRNKVAMATVMETKESKGRSYKHVSVTDSWTWHSRLGHPGTEPIRYLEANSRGARLHGSPPKPRDCEICQLAFAKARRSREPRRKSTRPFAVIHVDIHDLDEAWNSDKFGFLATCEASNYHLGMTAPTKDKLRDFIWGVIAIVKVQFGFEVQEIQSDNDKVYTDDFRSDLRIKGVYLNCSAPYTHDQNGLSERAGGVWKDKSRALLIEANLPLTLWGYAFMTVIYLLNRTPCYKINWMSPLQYVHKHADVEPANRKDYVPWLGHLRVFGCKAYAYINKERRNAEKRSRHEPRAHIGYLVGYRSTNIWEIWLPQFNRVVATRDVTFQEDQFYNPKDVELLTQVKEVTTVDLRIREIAPGVPLIEELEPEDEEESEVYEIPDEAPSRQLLEEQAEAETRAHLHKDGPQDTPPSGTGLPSPVSSPERALNPSTSTGGVETPSSSSEEATPSSESPDPAVSPAQPGETPSAIGDQFQSLASRPRGQAPSSSEELRSGSRQRRGGLPIDAPGPSGGAPGWRELAAEPKRRPGRPRGSTNRKGRGPRSGGSVSTRSHIGVDQDQGDAFANQSENLFTRSEDPGTQADLRRSRRLIEQPQRSDQTDEDCVRNDDLGTRSDAQRSQSGALEDEIVVKRGPKGPREDVQEDNIIEGSRTRKPSEKARRSAYSVIRQEGYSLSAFYSAILDSQQATRWHSSKLPPIPKSFRSLRNHPLKREIFAAMAKEWETLTRKGTWEIVDRPSNVSTLPLMWVYAYKHDSNGFLAKVKARLCVRGDLQPTASGDYYASTLSFKVFRMLMVLMAIFDLEARQLDAVNAFANTLIDQTVYLQFPEGFRQEGKLLLLQKALYGLRQSPRLWLQALGKVLLTLGLIQSRHEPCLFFNAYLFVFFFVDDIVILFRKEHEIHYEQFKEKLMSSFEMTDIGDLQWFLGIRIIRDRLHRKVWLVQDAYIDRLSHRFKLRDRKKATPIAPLQPMEKSTDLASTSSIHSFQQKVGSLQYSASSTRPDVAKAAAELAKHLTNPGHHHHQAADSALVYLNGTREMAMLYEPPKDTNIGLQIYADASYADDREDRKSSFGYLVQIYGNTIDWKSGKQNSVTTSTTEAELHALTTAVKEAAWWQLLIAEIELTIKSITVLSDNLQTVRLVTSKLPVITTKLRHVDIHQHWLRQEYLAGRLNIEWVNTNGMLADGLTKLLPPQKQEVFRNQLGLVDASELVPAASFDQMAEENEEEEEVDVVNQ